MNAVSIMAHIPQITYFPDKGGYFRYYSRDMFFGDSTLVFYPFRHIPYFSVTRNLILTLFSEVQNVTRSYRFPPYPVYRYPFVALVNYESRNS